MAPSISPNKTWSGFGGGALASMVTVTILFAAIPSVDIAWWHGIWVGIGFTVFGQAGDILVSYYKRKINTKDTGTLIPGHGGLLDRIDSLLLVTPYFFLTLQVLLT